MKKAFMIVDILVAIVLLGILLLGSVKAMTYINTTHQVNELRYLTLNKIDSEMARLVMTYENKTLATFVDTTAGKSTYKTNPIADDYGLKILNTTPKNLVEIKNVTSTSDFNTVDDKDIVGVLSWIEEINPSIDVNLSLSIKYPYRFNAIDETITPIWSFTETLVLKTSTKIK